MLANNKACMLRQFLPRLPAWPFEQNPQDLRGAFASMAHGGGGEVRVGIIGRLVPNAWVSLASLCNLSELIALLQELAETLRNFIYQVCKR